MLDYETNEIYEINKEIRSKTLKDLMYSCNNGSCSIYFRGMYFNYYS